MTQAPIQPGDYPTSQAGWQMKAQLFDYRQAANPVRRGLTEPIPCHRWSASLHQSGGTAILPLDLSGELGCSGPATSPALAAHFLRIIAGEGLKLAANATSSLIYVLQGEGELGWNGESLNWKCGDLLVTPAGGTPLLQADQTSVLYWVHDGPLLDFLGVAPCSASFAPTHYPSALLEKELNQLLADPSASRSNRLSLLLANQDLPQSRTVTHTLWAMLGVVPAGVIQPPHRHQSVALDLIIDCDPGCHTLVGTEIDSNGQIVNAQRIDWEPGGAFITPPGHWHAHVNTSTRQARLLPIQDAGLHTYLRSLDIRFAGGLQSGN